MVAAPWGRLHRAATVVLDDLLPLPSLLLFLRLARASALARSVRQGGEVRAVLLVHAGEIDRQEGLVVAPQ